MVATIGGKKKQLYIVAWEAGWNEEREHGGKPYDCDRCARSPQLKASLGCDVPRAKPYRIGPERIEVYRCPMSYVAKPDAEVLAMSRAAADHDAGVIQGWPHSYTGRFEDGTRTLMSQRARCQSAVIKARGDRSKARR